MAKLVLVLPFSLALILSCADGTDEPGEPTEPASWTLASEPTVVIGQAVGEPQYLFSRIGPVRVLHDGRIAVADRDAAGIRLYSPNGTFELEIGRRGEGPGEFGWISSLSVTRPDTLVVFDSRLHRVTKFLTSGALASTRNLQPEDGNPVLLGEFTTGELAVAWIKAGPRDYYEMTPDVMQLARFSREGRLSALLGTETGIVRGGSSAWAFSPYLHAEVIGDSIFLTNGLLPGIQVWNDQGEVVRKIQLPLPAVDPSSAWSILEYVLLARGNSTELGWFENQPRDDAIPRISRMTLDGDDRVLGMTTDELGVERVLAYQVRQ